MTLIQMPEEYTVIQGDALSLLRSMPDNSVQAIIADPPYGVNYQSQWTGTERFKKIANDKHPFIWWLYDAYRVLAENHALVCFCDWRTQEAFRQAIEIAGFTVKSQVIWHRDWHGMGDLKGAFGPDHDVIWFATKGRFTFPGARPTSVFSYRRPAPTQIQHPNEKPVELMLRLVTALTVSGEIVLDPFCGSGVVGEACVRLSRRFIGFDLDPDYAALSDNRIHRVMQTIEE